jgi:hypothetical protein
MTLDLGQFGAIFIEEKYSGFGKMENLGKE